MKIKYEIKSSRSDVKPEVITSFVTEGSSTQECDKEARERFDKLCTEEAYSWDDLELIRIDIERMTTPITRCDRQAHTLQFEAEMKKHSAA